MKHLTTIIYLSYSLLVAGAFVSTNAQQRDPSQPRPTPTPRPVVVTPGNPLQREKGSKVSVEPGIYGTIRWSKAMGLPFDSSRVRPPYPPCYLFRQRLQIQEGQPGTLGSPRVIASVLADGSLTEENGYYVCRYRIPDDGSIPRNAPMTLTSEFDFRHPEASNQDWVLGSNATPPPGQQRVIIIIGGRTSNLVSLTQSERHRDMDFEMVYRSLPAPPR